MAKLRSSSVSYTLPSPDVLIDAEFWSDRSNPLMTNSYRDSEMLRVVSGTLRAEDRRMNSGEFVVDIELQTPTMEQISVAGNMTGSNCTPYDEKICND
jgi:hypothetical protein